MKKRIIFICKGHQNIAGAQLYLKQISSLFPPTRYEIHYALRKADGIRVFEEIRKNCNLCLWDYDWRHLPFWKSVGAGFKLFRQVGADLIIFNSSEDKVLAAIWASLLAGIRKRIMVVHWAQSADSLPLFRLKSSIHIPIPSRYSLKTRSIRGLSLGLLHRLIFVNNMTKEAYARLYKVPRKRCVTIYNGIELRKFVCPECERTIVRRQLGLKENDLMIFAAGNLTEVKGFEYLIEATGRLAKKFPSLKCFIAGQGELKEALKQKITDRKLREVVRLLGYRSDISSLLAAADIFSMPSMNEALGYSLLEAMAAGLPVVASNVGGIPEVVTNGKEGLLVPPKIPNELAAAIEFLINNPDVRREMGTNGRRTVEKRFTVEKMLDETRRVIMGELGAHV